MDFGLSDEQRLLQETANRFVADVCPSERAKQWDEEHHYPAELFTGFAEMGWFELPFPEDQGGGGGGAADLAVIAEALGHASLDVAQCFILTLMGGFVIQQWGTDDMRRELLPAVMRAERRLSIGMSEPDAGSDAAALRTFAEDKGDSFVVNGQKMWCTGAGLPGTDIVLYVRTNRDEAKHRGLSVLLLDPHAPGVELRKIDTLARHILGTYEVYLDNVEIPKSSLLGQIDCGWEVMLSGLDVERVLISGGYVGAAQATVDEALAYAKQRHAFGRPIGEFQAITHALADMQTDVDAARLLVQRAAWMHDEGVDSGGRAGAMAKLKGSETYVAAARLGMQILAGHGFATESTMSFRYRESIVAPISGGTSQIQRNAIARTMGLRGY
ncbi:MAG TPA: acyl-CoA dehydrogenase family protein [Acidimicrobiales bacterium]|jgi:alkylation response protein AidB-like acyl-CoA dehydrogenase|nr:acyl-CoA dehydrogenase family protein [Acidimicrobiales bacterium]